MYKQCVVLYCIEYTLPLHLDSTDSLHFDIWPHLTHLVGYDSDVMSAHLQLVLVQRDALV